MGRVDRATGRETHLSADELRTRASRMRALDLVSIHAAGSGHPGGTLSDMDIAAVLFLDEAPAVYAALVQAGFCREETGAVLTCEEHQKGGFGNLIAGALSSRKGMNDPFVFDMMGVPDRFGESGKPRELMIRFGLTAEHIAACARQLVRRKGGRD